MVIERMLVWTGARQKRALTQVTYLRASVRIDGSRTVPSAISNANRGVTFVHTRFWTTLNSGSFDLIEHFHRMLVTAPAADLGRFTAIRFRSARLRRNWEFARHTSNARCWSAWRGA